MSKTKHEIYTITKIDDEAKDAKTFKSDKNMDSRPGHFVMAWLPGISENPFSVSYSRPFGITVKKVGDENSFTSKLFELEVGDKIWVRGPYGNRFPRHAGEVPDGIIAGIGDHTNNAYLIAGGTGAIPLAYLSENLRIYGFHTTVFLGARTRDEIIFEDRFTRSSEELHVSTDDGSSGYKGFVTDLFADFYREYTIKSNSLFYICGPEKMMKDAAEKAMKFTEPKNIFLSLERYMKCGNGVCGSCEINGYRVCSDGPVFSYEQISGGDFGKYARTKSGVRKEL